MRRLPTATVQAAVSQLQHGKSIREVSKALNISSGAVYKIRQKNLKSIPNPKMGRPSKVSKSTKRYIARQYHIGKLRSLREAQELIQSMDGVQVQVESIRRFIHEENLEEYKVPRRLGLSKDQKVAP
ncbi:hypothetical protein BGZ51_002835 [Haplosporangium sp. Z 767]|nr:hypothetical protein BGZ51_002835 [Haplosporangium sp. Z 767]KAF9196252.1 hypothetical protein BGZ50_001328 [Haplosporangium sp. Z 11]